MPATSQSIFANIVDGFTHTLCKAGGGAEDINIITSMC